YDELLRDRGVTTAQVLLTFFDLSARTHYLNACQTLRKLLDWRVLPVINENDTTTTDDISFGDNDFLAAQVAVLTGADLLLLLTDTDGLYTADPRRDAGAEHVAEVTDFRGLAAVQRRDALQGGRGGDGDRGRHRGGDRQRPGAGHRPRRRGGRARGHA